MLVIIGVVVFIAIFVLPWMILSDVSNANKKRAKAEANPGPLLDGIFNGENTVTHTVEDSGLSYETVMKAAPDYGYKFVTENQPRYGGPTLVFKKV